ncbi:MAG: hypothetical protein GX427_02200 [Actinomycetales bacterium]|nr:hypothetical protein [Actinomycetales bacterium]
MSRWRVALAAVLVLTACQSGPDQQTSESRQITVTGEFGSIPVVTFDAPLPVKEGTIEKLVTGEGRELVPDGPALLAITAYDGDDGTVLTDRSPGVPRNLLLTTEDVGATLYDVLVGSTEGTRLLMTQPVDDGGPDAMLVVVIDVLHTRATGSPGEAPPEGIAVTLEEGGAPVLGSLAAVAEPTSLGIVPLLVGEGPQVRPGQQLIAQYTAWNWDDGSVYDSTWANGGIPATITLDETFPGLRNGVVDQKVGSQVLLLIPPALARGTDALAIVVDILAVVGEGRVAEESPPAPSSPASP